MLSGPSKLRTVNPELGRTRGRATQANEGEGGEGSTGEGLRGLPEEDGQPCWVLGQRWPGRAWWGSVSAQLQSGAWEEHQVEILLQKLTL